LRMMWGTYPGPHERKKGMPENLEILGHRKSGKRNAHVDETSFTQSEQATTKGGLAEQQQRREINPRMKGRSGTGMPDKGWRGFTKPPPFLFSTRSIVSLSVVFLRRFPRQIK